MLDTKKQASSTHLSKYFQTDACLNIVGSKEGWHSEISILLTIILKYVVVVVVSIFTINNPVHGDPTDMRKSTSVFQIRTINRPKLDKRQVSEDRFL